MYSIRVESKIIIVHLTHNCFFHQSCSLSLSSLFFTLLSGFMPYSTIRTPGTGFYQEYLKSHFNHFVYRHNSIPRLPAIPGLKSFPGVVMHSHDYRHPEVFTGKHLVILGAGASGLDICLNVANCAEKVYLSHKRSLCSKLPENVEQQRPIMSISVDGTVLFEDGQERKVDFILLCAGYIFSFPLLHDDCSIQVRNNRVTHLYKHIFNTKHPTLSFIGVCSLFC